MSAYLVVLFACLCLAGGQVYALAVYDPADPLEADIAAVFSVVCGVMTLMPELCK